MNKNTEPITSRRAGLLEKARFASVGVANTLLDLTVLNVLTQLAHAPILLSNIISTFCAMCLSLVLNKYFVFKDKAPLTGREFWLFIAVTLSSLWVIQSIIIFVLTQAFPQPVTFLAHGILEVLPRDFVSESFLVTNGAKIVAVVASLIWNYYFYKRLVFKTS